MAGYRADQSGCVPMQALTFDAADVGRVVEHLIAAKTQMRSARQITSNPPSAGSEQSAVVPAVVLGCDHGVYLMSNGEPRDLIEGPRSFVAYAAGYDPYRDAHWRVHTRDLIGGDASTAAALIPEDPDVPPAASAAIAAEKAIERQRRALDLINYDRAASSRLESLIVEPSSARVVDIDVTEVEAAYAL